MSVVEDRKKLCAASAEVAVESLLDDVPVVVVVVPLAGKSLVIAVIDCFGEKMAFITIIPLASMD